MAICSSITFYALIVYCILEKQGSNRYSGLGPTEHHHDGDYFSDEDHFSHSTQNGTTGFVADKTVTLRVP